LTEVVEITYFISSRTGEVMLKALDDLEKAVSRLVEKTGKKSPGGSFSEDTAVPRVKSPPDRSEGQPDRINEEAAELIRRALKRLRSL
jgi:tRNA(Ser,Leu) C12 N-acetylase TAN1